MSAPIKGQRSSRALCDEGGSVHTWEAKGLDTNGRGVLVNVRACLRCDVVQEKPYGASVGWARRGWDDARCEWPARRGATEKCGRPAVAVMASTTPDTAEPDPWSRHVCGIHRRRAITVGWVERSDGES